MLAFPAVRRTVTTRAARLILLAPLAVTLLGTAPAGAAAVPLAGGEIHVPAGCSIGQALTKANELPSSRPGVRMFRHPCGGTVLQVSSSALAQARQAASGQVAPHIAAPAHASGAMRVSQGDDSVGFSPVGASAVTPGRRGEELQYAGAFPGASLVYAPTTSGVKESIVLSDARTSRFTFRLSLSAGLKAHQDGHAVSVRRGSDPVAQIAAPFMSDASPAHATTGVSMHLTGDAAGQSIVIKADPAWVAEHLRYGPVTIDPTVGFEPADPDCEIQSTAPDSNFCSGQTLGVGVTGSGSSARRRRTLLRYSIQRWLPKGAQVFQATLFAKVTSAPSSPISIDVVSPTKPWTYGVTWNKYDGTNGWTSPGGDYGSTPVANNATVGDTVGAYESWNVTSAVQSWADSGNTNGGFGLELKEHSEATASGDVEFASSENTAAAGDQLDIYYNNLSGALPYYHFDASRKLTDRLSMGVNVANGNLLLRSHDLAVKGTGLDLAFDRYYNSREAAHYSSGMGWTYSSDSQVHLTTVDNGNVQFAGPSDYTQQFVLSGSSYVAPSGLEATLKKNSDGTFLLTWNKSGEKWAFDTAGKLATMTDHNGNHLTLTYNSAGAVSTITDTEGRVVTLDSSSGRVLSATDSTGRKVAYAYNTTGSGETSPGLLMTSSTDQNGKTTKYGYGDIGGSALTSITDPNGGITAFTYDAQRRITKVAWAGGGATSFAYGTATTACGNDLNTVVTDPLGHATTYCWENPGRVTKTIDAAGNSTSTSYTSDSNVHTQTDPASKTTTLGYDSLNNLTSASTPANETLSWAYSDSTHPYSQTKATNARGSSSVATYDASGNKTSVADGGSPANSTVRLEYTGQTGGSCSNPSGPAGTVRCSIDANGNKTLYSYDAKGNLTKVTPPIPMLPTTITVDALSRTASVTDGKGQKKTYTYDNDDHVTHIDFADSSGAIQSSITFTYDANGNLLSRAETAGTTSYSYDARNRLTKDAFPDQTTNSYGYDLADNVTSLTDAGGTVTYGYDSRNLPSSIAEPGGSCTGTISACTTMVYDARGRHQSTTYPNGVTQTWTHDDDGHVTDLVAKNSAGTVLKDSAYSYTDPASGKATDLRFSLTDQAANKTAYSYDALDRLTAAITKASSGAGATTDSYSYAYDPAGNITSKTGMANSGASTTTSSTYNADNQLCWAISGALPTGASCTSPPSGVTSYSFDADGNQTQRTDAAGAASLALTYNARNQNDTVTVPGQPTGNVAYLGTDETERISAGGIAFHNSSLGLGYRGSTYFTRAADGTLISGRTSSGGSYYYLYDGLGSVIGLTDASGALIRSYKYDPYGATVTNSGSGPIDYFRYTAAYSGSGGLIHNGQRYYDPATGRWTQQDPISQVSDLGQANRYGYVAGDPVNLVDPSGDISISGVFNSAKDAACVLLACRAMAGQAPPEGFSPSDPLPADKIVRVVEYGGAAAAEVLEGPETG